MNEVIKLIHGDGGKHTKILIEKLFYKHFNNNKTIRIMSNFMKEKEYVITRDLEDGRRIMVVGVLSQTTYQHRLKVVETLNTKGGEEILEFGAQKARKIAHDRQTGDCGRQSGCYIHI